MRIRIKPGIIIPNTYRFVFDTHKELMCLYTYLLLCGVKEHKNMPLNYFFFRLQQGG